MRKRHVSVSKYCNYPEGGVVFQCLTLCCITGHVTCKWLRHFLDSRHEPQVDAWHCPSLSPLSLVSNKSSLLPIEVKNSSIMLNTIRTWERIVRPTKSRVPLQFFTPLNRIGLFLQVWVQTYFSVGRIMIFKMLAIYLRMIYCYLLNSSESNVVYHPNISMAIFR